MLHDPTRHEPLQALSWSEDSARDTITRIVQDTESRFSPNDFWPMHPRDADDGDFRPATPLYHGATGVVWALHHLQAIGAARLQRRYADCIAPLLRRNTEWLGADGLKERASYLMGDTGILLVAECIEPSTDKLHRLEQLIAGNLDNPTRELMWGAPGTMLAALWLHQRSGEHRWAELFRVNARKLWSQLVWSDAHQCHYWTQDMYGSTSSYLDAVHGFVATASVLIRGRHLLADDAWRAWQECIASTIARSASREGPLANWRTRLDVAPGTTPRLLMQFCHGAPGFVICLADFPGSELDDLLIAAGEATWTAGPLTKGSNLCHGTGGNGYAFLALHRRTGDAMWLERARAFAMHGIAQADADAKQHGRMRYSLWTGDPGFAIYLWDCIHARAAFPTLDVFFAD
jgi:hypothetical protein